MWCFYLLMRGCIVVIMFVGRVQSIMILIVYNFVIQKNHDVHNLGFIVCIDEFDMACSR